MASLVTSPAVSTPMEKEETSSSVAVLYMACVFYFILFVHGMRDHKREGRRKEKFSKVRALVH
jgi:hypothetical protein